MPRRPGIRARHRGRGVHDRDRHDVRLSGVLGMKTAPATDKDLPANVSELTRLVLAANPLHRRFLESALAAATAEEMDHLSVYIDFCLNRGLAMDYLAESYLTIVQDMLR